MKRKKSKENYKKRAQVHKIDSDVKHSGGLEAELVNAVGGSGERPGLSRYYISIFDMIPMFQS